MIGVDEALGRILAAVDARGALPAEEVPLREACGRILRAPVTADRDMPPFTRSAMDGYALRAGDVAAAPVVLEVIEEIPAGRPPTRTVGPGQASRIMTGAVLPAGADAVQMVEKTREAGPGRAEILEPVTSGTHVRRAGEEIERGSTLLDAGADIGAAAVALLASAGRACVPVSCRPRVAIVPTGDELVDVGSEPGPSQIRESNGHALRALVAAAGGVPDLHAVARDRRGDLVGAIGRALTGSDVLLMSGGVSMGDYDLVGGALLELGCRRSFDRVAIQPGKPLWFGTAGEEGRVLVFGLPGNPVSTIVDFLVFARPALRRLMGSTRCGDALVAGRLAAPVHRRPGRRAYLPARLEAGVDGPVVRLIPSMGSSDMVSLSRADVLAIIPENAASLEAGVMVRALPLAGWTTPGGGATGPDRP